MVRLIPWTASGALAAISSASARAASSRPVPGDHLLHDPEAQGRGGVDAPAGHGEELGPPGADLLGQAQVAAGVEGHAERRLGQGERGVVGRHPQVAHHGELEASAQAVALDRHHHGLGQVRQHLEALVDPADALVGVAHPLGGRAALDAVVEEAAVDAGAERVARGPQHDDADLGVEAELVGPVGDGPGGVPPPGVARLGSVEHQAWRRGRRARGARRARSSVGPEVRHGPILPRRRGHRQMAARRQP